MALITLRVIDGADRGRVFADVPTPLTIGREEGNPIQLNDERISRFHLKIQEDQHKIVLTDLQSTNGTKVNGESVQIWVLAAGRRDRAGPNGPGVRLARRDCRSGWPRCAASISPRASTLDADEFEEEPSAASLDFELNFGDDPDAQVFSTRWRRPSCPTRSAPARPPNWPRCSSTSISACAG